MTEVWKSVPGYEGFYEASNLGRVKTLSRWVPFKTGGGRQQKEKVMKLNRHDQGYRQVTLYKDGTRVNRFVHALVLQAFVGPCPEGMECCHDNGDRADNRLENLRWDTLASNQADRLIHGTDHRGERQGSSKLTTADVRQIKKLLRRGVFSTLR